MAKCSITDKQLFAQIRKVKEAGGNIDVFAAHMVSLRDTKENGVLAYAVNDTDDVLKYWREKYTAFRANMSAAEKLYRKEGPKQNIVLADHLKSSLELSKLGAAVKKKAEERWSDIAGEVKGWLADIAAKKEAETAGTPS